MKNFILNYRGYCSICETNVEFKSSETWYRDHLNCNGCKSIPRERALALVLNQLIPNYRNLIIHESSPVNRGISSKLKKECPKYLATQFYPNETPGKIINGFQNENLEKLTFAENSFDLFISLDVLEHVNYPELVFKELARTLKIGGSCLFTVPTYKGLTNSLRRALYRDDGSVDFLNFEPEYHGNPVSNDGSLVTFHYGYDLPELIHQWSGLDTIVNRFHDKFHGIIGEFTEVYLLKKRQ